MAPPAERPGLAFTGKPGHRTFTSIPPYPYARQRIFGTETEFGVLGPFPNTNRFLENGARLYQDCGLHLEYATPETSNPLSAVVYEKAGEALSRLFVPRTTKLYKNNVDAQGVTFGAHENYFTCAPFDSLSRILPFLVTRQVYAGAGHLENDGHFSIAQRSRYLRLPTGGGTTGDRAILCLKNEPLAEMAGWRRLHLILGDANMCEAALFLKLGTTGLVLDLAEDKKLPDVPYLTANAVFDAQMIAAQVSGWTLTGSPFHITATDAQRRYLGAAANAYEGRDEITDEILHRWNRTLDVLDTHREDLFGEVDWVTKKLLLDKYRAKHRLGPTDERLRNLDLQYHDTDPDTSLFYALQKAGSIDRLVTDAPIEEAAVNPPPDTRAFLRGRLVQLLAQGGPRMDVGWQGYGLLGDEGCPCGKCVPPRYPDLHGRLDDPFRTYEERLPALEKDLRKAASPRR